MNEALNFSYNNSDQLLFQDLEVEVEVEVEVFDFIESQSCFHIGAAVAFFLIVGKDFDVSTMSISQPFESVLHPDGMLELPRNMAATIEGSKVMKGKFKEMQISGSNRRANMSTVQGLLEFEDFIGDAMGQKGHGGNTPEKMGSMGAPTGFRLLQRMQRLLTLYTSCPLHHRWVDLGMRYWPRWVRTSSCLERHSCSIPAGFKCLPSNFSRKIILHYFCPKDEFQTQHCEWLRQQMLVVTDCSCSCPFVQKS